MTSIEATILTKAAGPLTKRIWLGSDGILRSDSSECALTYGTAKRWRFNDVNDVAGEIVEFASENALALGALKPGLPDRVRITTARTLMRLNGAEPPPDLVARNLTNFSFRPGVPALSLFDYDTKDLPPEIKVKIDSIGGFWPAIVMVVPALVSAARVERASTSAGLYNAITGAKLPSSSGRHVYTITEDGSDTGRFLTTLHQRCWLAGFGWLTIGTAGQLLERSIVDRTVGSPERLVFEGPPVLVPPLRQDLDLRRPIATAGDVIDTRRVCPLLTPTEETRFNELIARARVRLKPEAERLRRVFIATMAARYDVAEREVEKRLSGILHPGIPLEFDDPEIANATVADVLANPERFIGETLADPIEGVEYGRGKATVMRGQGGIVVHSFAHSLNAVYRLLHDGRSTEDAIRVAPNGEAVRALCRCLVNGDLDPIEEERVIGVAVEVSGSAKRPVGKAVKLAKEEAAGERAREARERRLAERIDPRPRLAVPSDDAEAIPVMDAVNPILGEAPEAIRNVERTAVRVRAKAAPSLHLLTSTEVNPDE
jgi:hypothetical protein